MLSGITVSGEVPYENLGGNGYMYMYYIASGNSDDYLIALITCTLRRYTISGEGPTMVWSPDYIL